MTSTFVPGIFVRSQLFRMPGDERKFKRRRIVAFMPACKREREFGASHTSALDGMPGAGVAVDSLGGVTVGEGTGVAVSEAATVDEGVFVGDGDGDEIGAGVAVAVADGKVFWMADVSVGFTVPVDGGEAEEREALVGVEDRARVGESGVGVGDSDWGMTASGVRPRFRNRKISRSRIATINLKRS